MKDTNTETGRAVEGDEGDVSVFEVAIAMAKHKALIIGLPILLGGIATIVTLFMTPLYTAKARILPPKQSQSAAASMLGQLGPLAGVAGGALGITPSAELYVGLLKSRTVADSLINRFDLKRVYNVNLMADARGRLEGASNIVAGKDGLITIEADSTDPQLAAALANAYVEELTRLTDILAVSEAGQRRLFFERQLRDAKSSLFQAEDAARRALQEGGIAMVDEQGKSLIETSAALRAQIAAKEVQVSAMRSFAADANPDIVRARRELAALQEQMEKIEGVTRGKKAPESKASGLQSTSLLRDVKYYQVLVDLLARQYEAAKIDEAKEGAVIQVVDKAVPPERRSKPKRTFITVLSALGAAVLAVLLAFGIEAFESAKRNPRSEEQIARLRRYLAWR